MSKKQIKKVSIMRKLFLPVILFAFFPLINQAQIKADSAQSSSSANQIQNNCCSKKNEKSNSKCAELHSKKSEKITADDKRKSLKNQIPPRSEWIMRSETDRRGT